jgi:hypothetical protein
MFRRSAPPRLMRGLEYWDLVNKACCHREHLEVSASADFLRFFKRNLLTLEGLHTARQ